MASQEKLEVLEIGKKFPSFEALKNFLAKYQQQKRQLFRIKNSKPLSFCKTGRIIDKRLSYHQIWYSCKFSNKRATQSTGVRNSRTFNAGCSASIIIGVAEDGKHLEIKKFNENHEGHDGSEAYFEHLPENRRLDDPEKQVAFDSLRLRCNKQFLRHKLATDCKKVVYQKDLQNLASTLKNADDDLLSKAVSLLENVYGADVSILHQENRFRGLYFSTSEMRTAMDSWPEIVFIDGTYKLFRRNFTLMMLLVEDSDGGSRVAGVGILATEERPTLKWFVECFAKEHQAARSRMRCLMGDKDLTERDVIKEVFPGIPMYICSFHTLRTFGREVSTIKLNITIQQREESLKLLDRLTESSSAQAYNEIYGEFCRKVPEPVLNYFNRNWQNIKSEWTRYSMVEGNLGNCTNNRLESLNSKIKQIVKRNSTMTTFVHDFFKWLSSRDHEMTNKRVQNLLKKDVVVYGEGTAEHRYKEYLTKYAFSTVLQGLRTHSSITIVKSNSGTRECLVTSRNVELRVTDSSCECSTWKSVGLPCRHIFAVRERFGLPLFAEQLCAERWTARYHRLANNETHSVPVASRSHVISSIRTPKKLTTHQKRKLLQATTNDIIQVASQCSDAKFESKLNVLRDIQQLWSQGHDICVTRAFTSLDDDRETTCLNSPTDGNNDSSRLSILSESLADMSISEQDQLLPVQSTDLSIEGSSCLDRIKLGVAVKMSGRPKAASQTTLTRSKRRKPEAIGFQDRTSVWQARKILSWLIETNILENVLLGEYKIQEKDIKHLRERGLTDSVVNDAVDLRVVEPYFERRGYSMLKKIVSTKQKGNKFTCGTCQEVVLESCVLCNSCLLWHHLACVQLKRAPKAANWFCQGCRRTT